MMPDAMRRMGVSALRVLALALLAGSLGCASPGQPDPLERMNRGVFAFNEGVDQWVLEPVAKGWDFVLPGFVQTGVGNFFDNLRMVRTFLNDVLQGEPVRAGSDLGRFAVNTTLGLAGLFDPATKFGIPHHTEDFGQTLGVWGLGPGAFIQIPLLGPSSGRDLVALPLDFVAMPTFWLPSPYPLVATVTDTINTRAEYIDEIAENRRTALDFYVFVRNAYLQNRERQVRNGEGTTEEEDEDLYELDDLDGDVDAELEADGE